MGLPVSLNRWREKVWKNLEGLNGNFILSRSLSKELLKIHMFTAEHRLSQARTHVITYVFLDSKAR